MPAGTLKEFDCSTSPARTSASPRWETARRSRSGSAGKGKGFEKLRACDFLREWTVKQARAAAKQLFDEVPARLTRGDAGGLLQHYYGEGLTERGRAEGVITLDWRYGQVTQQPIAEICALSPEPLTVEHELGESLLPLLGAINGELDERGSANRFFSLDVDSDFYVIACRPKDFESRIASTAWLTLG